jgi:hypothetical protein
MILKDFKFDHVVKDDGNGITHILTLTSEVVIVRDKKTYSVPLIQMYEYPMKNYNVEVLELSILGYMRYAEEIFKKWKLVTEQIVKLEGGGRIITQHPFDIINDLS